MLTKKTKKADLESKRPMFFQIGLIVSLSLALLAFEWTTKSSNGILTYDLGDEDLFTEQVVITKREVLKKEPQVKLKELKLQIIDELDFYEDFIPTDVEFEENYELPEYLFDPEPAVNDDDVPVYNADRMPSFMGKDLNGFHEYVTRNIIYPEEAIDIGLTGKVTIRFVVDKSGKVKDIEIIRSAYPCLDEEAIRVIESSPLWTPGENKGKAVEVYYVIPVNFKLH